ncbi:hypothetical protein COU77_02860 [Candidatus Peregrinibacteria bacterium CG10_big_fil_rev_8_21_14_0_10_49_16]|nr:MAG: hypothetical protein COW95_02375 [Candidatus Peregrinibacteria bacterium CG22_combo_CG10-13_8_21_14_all_49_11]PIR51977.1 MAG: hypothetical protein COU77_02860 [Candidatus Peregrinibacteria bacterium CG10_big_fil_rev_8_21_14_0_10_49_16]
MRIEHVATILFGLAILHTFCAKLFHKLGEKFPEGSKFENLFHLLGETEAVFLMWAGALFGVMIFYLGSSHHFEHGWSLAAAWESAHHGWHEAVHYIESLNYTEPKFVFVIMVIAATKPVVDMVDKLIRLVSRLIPLHGSAGFLLSAMVVGPLLGSLVTEPAAMTVTALVLKRQFFDRGISMKFKYMLIGTLFVSVSIGGTLSHFAAPPVLMVAGTWNWGMAYMFTHFGYKAATAVLLSAALLVWLFYHELKKLPLLSDSDIHGREGEAKLPNTPWWVTCVHIATLALVVLHAHHPDIFMGIFVFFLAFCFVTKEYQEDLKLKGGLLVGGFLAGLVTLGGLQRWWLEPLLGSMGPEALFLGTTGLTAVTDNAALTFLGSQVPNLSEAMKFALVAGAVAGGGLTVIANAPNPAGYSILNSTFKENGSGEISSLWLLLAALPPTLIAMICLWFLPSF